MTPRGGRLSMPKFPSMLKKPGWVLVWKHLIRCRRFISSTSLLWNVFFYTRIIKRSQVRIPLGRLLISLNYTTSKRYFCTRLIKRSRVQISLRRLQSVNIVELHYFQTFFEHASRSWLESAAYKVVGSYRWITLLSNVYICTRLVKSSWARIPFDRRSLSLNHTAFKRFFLAHV